MFLCSITPVKNKELMYDRVCVMLLAHLSEKYPEYSEMASKSSCYKIMDNSIIEKGNAFNLKDLVNEAHKCKANEIILPDVYKDAKETVKKVKESIKWLKNNWCYYDFQLMAVCHGNNKEEFEWCFNELNNIKEINVIGVPKVINKWCGSRNNFMYLYQKSKKQIHYLGAPDNFNELVELKDNLNKLLIRSIDTCLPSLLAIEGKSYLDNRREVTIDLEKEEIPLENYKKIIEDIDKDFELD